MNSSAKTPKEYLEQLPLERKQALEAVRDAILANLPKGYVETMRWGMITYEVPLEVYPDTYNGQPLMYAALGSQKNYMSLYLMSVYGDPQLQQQFETGFMAAGKKLDMGKSCVRFKKFEDLPLEVIGKAIAATPMSQFIEHAKAVQRKKG